MHLKSTFNLVSDADVESGLQEIKVISKGDPQDIPTDPTKKLVGFTIENQSKYLAYFNSDGSYLKLSRVSKIFTKLMQKLLAKAKAPSTFLR